MTRSSTFARRVPLAALFLLGCTGGTDHLSDARGSGGIGQAGGSSPLGGSFGSTGGISGLGGRIGVGGAPLCGMTNVVSVTATGGSNVSGTKTQFPPSVGSTTSQGSAPPAISGGTLLVLADGTTAVAADPDRDAVYVVDLSARSLKATVALQPGDEPGRLAEDASGRVHVALRQSGALVTIDPVTGQVLQRRAVCAAPRGVAYDPATDVVHVACLDGSLVSLPAAGGDPIRNLQVGPDLRDVIVDGSRLLVTHFKAADLSAVAADGTVTTVAQPPAFSSSRAHGGSMFTPSTAWRAVKAPDGGTLILHQRGMVDPIVIGPGGYGGPSPCDAIVHSCITHIDKDGKASSGPALASLVLAVDLAVSPDGQKVAVIAAGNATNIDALATTSGPALARVFVTDLQSAIDPQVGCVNDGTHGPCLPSTLLGGVAGRSVGASLGGASGTATGSGGSPGGLTGAGGASGPLMGAGGAIGSGGTGGSPVPTNCPIVPPGVPPSVGQPIAVAFDGSGSVVVQSREPAMLALSDGSTISLSPVSRADMGHTLFHANSGGFLACASCHSEGNEDGRVWNFSCEGPRRTQSLQVGLMGTEPFHWDGSETDFNRLLVDVFQGRMSGPPLSADQGAALLSWLDQQPRPAQPAQDPVAVAHGKMLFESPDHGCALCHSGPKLTNNLTVDVGTGGAFQVPSLVGVGNRAPYLHDGCAPTLADRFGPCGGGDQHGVTSTLSASDVSDLVAYLRTL